MVRFDEVIIRCFCRYIWIGWVRVIRRMLFVVFRFWEKFILFLVIENRE